MVRRISLVLAVLALQLGWLLPAAAQETAVADQATAWLKTQQQADGSFAGFSVGSTADALVALAASGVKADDVAVGGVNAQQFIEKNVAQIAAKPGVAAKFVVAELLTGHSPRNVAGTDLVAVVVKSYDSATGVYGPDVTSHALALLALVAAGEKVEPDAIAALEKFQLEDGSWSFSGDRTAGGGDTNTTALAVQALVAASGKGAPAVGKAVAYLATQRNADGGFPYAKGSDYGANTDANSTALVIQAIVAAGGNPTAAPWADAQGNPLAALIKLQNASGAFRYDAATPDDNAFATYQAIPAVLLKPFPLEQIFIAQQPAPAPTAAPAPPTAAPAPPAGGAPATLPNTGAPANPLPWLLIAGAGAVLLGARLRRRAA